MVTGEPGFAKTYLLTEQIDRNAIPTAPVLGTPAQHAADLALPIDFTWDKSTDADGDTVTYQHCVWDVHERFSFNQCSADSVERLTWSGGLVCWVLVLLAGVLLIVVLIALGRKRPGVLIVAAVALLIVLVLIFYFCVTKTGAKTVTELEPGKAYYWKVIAEDGKGGTVESETRRFTLK
jgi:hypothetical protein